MLGHQVRGPSTPVELQLVILSGRISCLTAVMNVLQETPWLRLPQLTCNAAAGAITKGEGRCNTATGAVWANSKGWEKGAPSLEALQHL